MEPNGTGNIIIVDDDKNVLHSTSLLLQEAGFVPSAFSTAEAALESIPRSGVEAVLSDIKMPNVSGIELLGRIHEINPDIPVILFTGHADLENAIAAIQQGAFDFILKPYQPEHLISTLQKAVRYRRMIVQEERYRRVLEELSMEIDTLISERSMGLMAMTVADRIRNPATIIGMACRKMRERGLLQPADETSARMIAEEAAKLEGIVADFERLLRERKSLFCYEDLTPLVRDAAAVVAEEAAQRQVVLALALEDRPHMMNLEKNLIKLAVLHVARNAVEATPGGGTVRIALTGTWDKVSLAIKDAGPGIPPEERERIFEPFYTTKKHRFGMGLPLVKQIVADHLGEMTVESVTGSGTTVTMTFPARWREAVSTERSEACTPSTK